MHNYVDQLISSVRNTLDFDTFLWILIVFFVYNSFLFQTASSIIQTPITRQQEMHFDSNTFANTSTNATPIVRPDNELSELMDIMIDLLPEYQGNMMAAPNQPIQEDVNKDIAINAITKQLMDIENTTFNSPPAYPMHNVNNTQSNQQVCYIYDL